MEQQLFGTLVDQCRKGKRADSGFKSEAWAAALLAVLDATPEDLKHLLSIDKLKSMEQNYKGLYKDRMWLLEQSGFGINHITGCVTASDQAWDDLLKVRN
jgi:hypothetical protein